jgi:hypothetical protein
MFKNICLITVSLYCVSCGNNKTDDTDKVINESAVVEPSKRFSLFDNNDLILPRLEDNLSLHNILNEGLLKSVPHRAKEIGGVYYTSFNFKTLEFKGEYKSKPATSSYYSVISENDLMKISRHDYKGYCNYELYVYPHKDYVILKGITFWDSYDHKANSKDLDGFMVYNKQDSTTYFFGINILFASKKLDSTNLINNVSSISILGSDSYPKESHYFCFGKEFFYTKSLYESNQDRNDFIYALNERLSSHLGVHDDFSISDTTKLSDLRKKLGGHDTGFLITKVKKQISHNLPSWCQDDDLY